MKLVVLLTLVCALLFAACPAALAADAGYEVREETGLIPVEGWEIPYTYTYPVLPDGAKAPGVVMLHGTGSNRDEAGGGYVMAAPALAKAGIANIRIDFVGNGESTGDYRSYTLTSGMADANAAILFLQARPELDAQQIGIMGWSQGGTIAMLTASRNPVIKSMVTWAGAVDMGGLWAEQYETAQQNGYAEVTFEWRTPLNVSLEWFEEVRSIKLPDELKNYSGAVLAIAGSNDDVVLPADTQVIVDACAGSTKEVLIIDGADHTYNVFTGDLAKVNELITATTDWFAKTL